MHFSGLFIAFNKYTFLLWVLLEAFVVAQYRIGALYFVDYSNRYLKST